MASTNLSREDFAKTLAAIIEKEYNIWTINRSFKPLSLNELRKIINGILPEHSPNRIIALLVNEGFLYEINGNYQSFVSLYAQKFTDLRKYTGYCLHQQSLMRTLGFDARLCKLSLPDFSAVRANDLANKLSSKGIVGKKAANIAKAWWPSYSSEQAEIIEELVESLLRQGINIYAIDMPTGSGKTEAFMIPAIANAMDGGLSIIVYPRKALATDQVRRIASLYLRLGESAPLLDVYDGESCYIGKPPKGGRACRERPERIPEISSKNGGHCKTSYAARGILIEARCSDSNQTVTLPLTDARLEELIGQGKIPRVLITNYDMFHRILSNMQRRDLHKSYFQRAEPRRAMLVFDEAHEFQGVDFMHMLLLTARFLLLLQRLGLSIPVTIVFSSATLPVGFEDMIKTMIGVISGSNVVVERLPRSQSSGVERTLLVTAVLPDPETSGQWLNQLGVFALTSFSQARIEKGLEPFKTIAFVDSLRYLREIYRRTGQTLLSDAQDVIKDHTPRISCNSQGSLDDPLNWELLFYSSSSIVANVARTLASQRYFDADHPGNGVLAEHHATLNPARRQVIETWFRDHNHPLTIIATSTLEMGVDIPSVTNILQFRKPRSEAGMIQRIGRAARGSDTLYTGFASIFLTSMPSDALLVLDKETFDRYLYRCKNIKAPAPRVNAPANKNILLSHMLYTAISNDNGVAQDFDRENRQSSSDRDRIRRIIINLKALINSSADELRRLARAAIEAYKQAGIPGLDLDANALIKEIIDDLDYAENILYKGTAKKLEELKEKIDKLCKRIRDSILAQLMEESSDIINSVGRYSIIPHNKINLLIELKKYNTINDQEYINILRYFKKLNDIIFSDLCISRQLLNREEDNVINSIQSTIENIEKTIENLYDEINTEKLIELLGGQDKYEVINKDINMLRSLLDEISSALEDLRQETITLREISMTRPSRILSELTSKPYFSALLRSSPRQIVIRTDCEIDSEPACGGERTDDPYSALRRTIPLSESGDREEAGFFFLPPGPGEMYDVEAYAIAYNPNRGTYFVKEVVLDKIIEELLNWQFNMNLAIGYRGSRHARIYLGENVNEARIFTYSSLAKIIADNIVYRQGDSRETPLRNPLFIVFVLRPKKENLPGLRIVVQIGRFRNGRVEPMKPGESISVGYCECSNTIFIGIDLNGARPSPTSFINCPLAEIQRAMYSQAISGMKKLWRGLKEINRACDHLHSNKAGCQCPISRGRIRVTDVLTYMLRSNPVTKIVLRRMGNKGSSIGVSSGLVRLDTYETSVTHRYSLLRLKVGNNEFFYPLPVTVNASLLRTYSAVIEFDRGLIEKGVDRLLDMFVNAVKPPIAMKWLLAKLILAASGSTKPSMWSNIETGLRRFLDNGEVPALVKVLEQLVRHVSLVLEKVLRGNQYVLSLSGVRRGAELLFDIAVENPGKVGLLYEAFRELVVKNRSLVREVVVRMTELTLAHSVYYAVATVNGYDDVMTLYRAVAGQGYSYALVEEREGGVGFLPTVTPDMVSEGLVKTMASAAKAMAMIRSGRERARRTLSPAVSKYIGLLDWIAQRVSEAYGAVVPRRNGVSVAFTFMPSWLARVVLTPEKLKHYAVFYKKWSGNNINIDEREWSNIATEVLPAVFDADFPDSPSMHIGGVNSWLGDYERRLLQSSLLVYIFYGLVR